MEAGSRLIRHQFHHRAITPPVLLARQTLDLVAQNRICLTENAGTRGKGSLSHAHLYRGIGMEILHPVRGWVFGDNVEPALALSEPYLDFARLPALAPACGQVQVLFAIPATGL